MNEKFRHRLFSAKLGHPCVTSWAVCQPIIIAGFDPFIANMKLDDSQKPLRDTDDGDDGDDGDDNDDDGDDNDDDDDAPFRN